MAIKQSRGYWLIALLLIVSGILVSRQLIQVWTPLPMVVVEMSSTVDSLAQIYYDEGRKFVEPDSVTVPVKANGAFAELRFVIPRGTVSALRFDPLQTAGTVEIRNLRIVEWDGATVQAIPAKLLRQFTDIKTMAERGGTMHVETLDNAKDPAVWVPLDKPAALPIPPPNGKILAALAVLNAPLWLLALVLVAPGFRARSMSALGLVDGRFAAIGARISSANFITFDRVAIWFLAGCAALFLVNVALDLNGSSINFNSKVFHQYGPQTVIAGTAKGIRSDEWNFVTPDMLYQVFRQKKFDAAESPVGNSYASLLANLPVSHATTLFRPQYWGFFVLPADYGFSFFWQMKWLLMVTGVFTLLLVLTRSSLLSAAGAVWLFFSASTQWTYSWPSMLPEMCGLFCFSVVLAMYLTVGKSVWMLRVGAVLLASCLVNFAMFAYVPHLIPYVWAGVFLFGGWVYSHREQVMAVEGRSQRLVAFGITAVLALGMLGIFYKDAAPAIAGIGATEYPGHRAYDGGEMWLPEFAAHFLGPFQDEARFVPAMHNISEAAGFLWFAPITLLCWGAMRALTRERKIFLVCLWIPALMLLGWDTLPLPAWFGHFLFLDKVAAQRTIPALGLLNMAIVMVVLSAPEFKRRLSIDSKLVIAVPTVYLSLGVANSLLDNYFSWREILLAGGWVVLMVGCLWDVRPKTFLALAVLPSIYFFGLINPIARGIGAVTGSDLFRFVEAHRELRTGKWLVMAPHAPYGIFAASGLDSYTGMHYLPPVSDFKILEAHGMEKAVVNRGGMLNAKAIEPGQKSVAEKLQDEAMQLDVNPSDAMLKELGIRYVAFEEAPTPGIAAGLEQLSPVPVSGFWLYRLPGN